MRNNYTTERLELQPLCREDAPFIQALVNTQGWLRFIGDRQIHSEADALAYINKILANADAHYRVVRRKDTGAAIGAITLIKRGYMEHHDIGFAFLPEHMGQGYAYEAATVVLDDLVDSGEHTHIQAITVKENVSSIKLLEKLGLRFSHETQEVEAALQVYDATTTMLIRN